MQQQRLINNSSQLNRFRAIILPILRNARLCVTACGIKHPRCYRPVADNIVGAPEDGKNNPPKFVDLTGIINKPLLLRLVGCLYYLYFITFF